MGAGLYLILPSKMVMLIGTSHNPRLLALHWGEYVNGSTIRVESMFVRLVSPTVSGILVLSLIHYGHYSFKKY